MKSLLLASSLMISTSIMAMPNIPLEQQVGEFTVTEVSSETMKSLAGIQGGALGGGGIVINPKPDPTPSQTPTQTRPSTTPMEKVENAGKVIQTARDLVALGEAVYEIVKKGKPTNVTEYAPISVVPRDPISKEYADPFDLEGFSMPVQKTYVATVKNGTGKEVVSFTYKVIYSYGGSYDGTGKFLTGVMIVPVSVRTTFGWEFNASMKVSSIMNHGTKAEPVAGLLLTIKYQMNSWSTSFERNDTVHVTGAGQLKTF